MRKKQVKELKKAILEDYLSDQEKNKIWEEAEKEAGDTKKIYRKKLFENGSKRDFLYKNGKKIFNKTPTNKKDIIEVKGGRNV